MHWPVAFRYSATEVFPVDPITGQIALEQVPIEDTWKAMEKLVEKGKVRSIGVSNFTREKIEKLLET